MGEKRDARTVTDVNNLLASRADAEHSIALSHKQAMLDGVVRLSKLAPSVSQNLENAREIVDRCNELRIIVWYIGSR